MMFKMKIKELETLFLSYAKDDFVNAESSDIARFLALLSWIENDRIAQEIFLKRNSLYWNHFWEMVVERRRLLLKKVKADSEKVDYNSVGEKVINCINSDEKNWNTLSVCFTPSPHGLTFEQEETIHTMWQIDNDNSVNKLIFTYKKLPVGKMTDAQYFVYQSENVMFNNEFLTILLLHYFLRETDLFFVYGDDSPAFFNSDVSAAMINLIYQQAKSHDALTNVIKDSRTFSDSVEQFLSSFDLNNVSQHKKISLFDLLSVSYKIKAHKTLSSFDLSLLTGSLNSSQDVRDVIFQNHLANSLQLVDIDEQKQLVQKLYQDAEFKRKYNVGNVYTIMNSSISHDLSHYQQTRTLLHGTSNVSVISILRDSLLPVSKIRDDYIYTGSSLGDGVYFAQLTESGKPVAYTDATDTRFGYLVVAEVGFNYVKHVDYFSRQVLQNGGLLIADKVGRGARDELCVYDENQINLKYLIEVKEK